MYVDEVVVAHRTNGASSGNARDDPIVVDESPILPVVEPSWVPKGFGNSVCLRRPPWFPSVVPAVEGWSGDGVADIWVGFDGWFGAGFGSCFSVLMRDVEVGFGFGVVDFSLGLEGGFGAGFVACLSVLMPHVEEWFGVGVANF